MLKAKTASRFTTAAAKLPTCLTTARCITPLFFKQSVRGLTAGSPVEYKGLNVGVVSDVPYFDRNDSLHLFENGWIPVRIRIEPSRLEINADEQSKEH